MLIKVKVCGIKTLEEIDLLNPYPVDYLGFIFAPSKRQVTQETARILRKKVRDGIQVVGVFVNESVPVINALVKACHLQVVQLHGEESVDDCKAIQAKVWKSISVKDEKSLEQIETYAPYVDGLLLDTYSGDEKGGSGKVFNWAWVDDLSESYPIILAGGLTPDNVVAAIHGVKPMVVDLNSGLETNLIKDGVKIKALFERLKEAGFYE